MGGSAPIASVSGGTAYPPSRMTSQLPASPWGGAGSNPTNGPTQPTRPMNPPTLTPPAGPLNPWTSTPNDPNMAMPRTQDFAHGGQVNAPSQQLPADDLSMGGHTMDFAHTGTPAQQQPIAPTDNLHTMDFAHSGTPMAGDMSPHTMDFAHGSQSQTPAQQPPPPSPTGAAASMQSPSVNNTNALMAMLLPLLGGFSQQANSGMYYRSPGRK